MARYDESDDDDVGALAPPTNFAMVERGLYRSAWAGAAGPCLAQSASPRLRADGGYAAGGFPKKKNFDFLRKLNLRTVLCVGRGARGGARPVDATASARTLVLEDYPAANLKFMREHGIQLLQVGVAGNKEPFVDMPEERIILALQHILGSRAAAAAWLRALCLA